RGETGFPRADVTDDFLRLRRRQVLARLATWLRLAPDDANVMLSLNEVLDALGRRGERGLGLPPIRLDTIVGTVDAKHDFDGGVRTKLSVGRGAPGPGGAGRGAVGGGGRGGGGGGSRSRRSRCTALATCTSCRTATTGCRSRWRPARRRSTRT